MLTTKEIFKRVKRRAKIKRRALTTDLGCGYRATDGIACFVGELIEDSEYDPSMEGHDVETLLEMFTFKNFSASQLDLLLRLQEIHDCHCIQEWEEALAELEAKYCGYGQ